MKEKKEKNKYADYNIYDIMDELKDIPRISTILEDLYYSHISPCIPYFDVHDAIINLDIDLEVKNQTLDNEDSEWLSVNICTKTLFECARSLGEIVIDGDIVYFLVKTCTYPTITQNPIATALLIWHVQNHYVYRYIADTWCGDGYIDHEFFEFLLRYYTVA